MDLHDPLLIIARRDRTRMRDLVAPASLLDLERLPGTVVRRPFGIICNALRSTPTLYVKLHLFGLPGRSANAAAWKVGNVRLILKLENIMRDEYLLLLP